MKKLLIAFALILTLSACTSSELTTEQQAQKIAEGTNVSTEITKLQLQLERGEVTEKYAQERLKQILKERQKANSGDTESILEKIRNEDPMLEKGLAEMIERQKASKEAHQE